MLHCIEFKQHIFMSFLSARFMSVFGLCRLYLGRVEFHSSNEVV